MFAWEAKQELVQMEQSRLFALLVPGGWGWGVGAAGAASVRRWGNTNQVDAALLFVQKPRQINK